MTSAIDRSALLYWALFTLNLPCVCILTLWAIAGIFSMHFGWQGAFINLILFVLAFGAIRNAFRAHVEKMLGEVEVANKMLAVSITGTSVIFAVLAYTTMVNR